MTSGLSDAARDAEKLKIEREIAEAKREAERDAAQINAGGATSKDPRPSHHVAEETGAEAGIVERPNITGAEARATRRSDFGSLW